MAVGEDEDEGIINSPKKLSHKKFRRLVKKERRRKQRQEAAKRREQKELEEKWRLENDPVLRARVEAREKIEKKRLQAEEEERQIQHRLWLEREAIAQEVFRKKKLDEERRLREKIEQEERIKKEWEEEQRKEREKEERKQQEIKEKEEALFRELDKPSIASEKNPSWHNPLAPRVDSKSYGTEQDTVNCSFYLKTGACRFGERCSRHHPRPTQSVTLMIPSMYNDIRLSQSMLDEADHDTGLEYDEKEAYENFKQFYEDTLPEFRKAGTVVQFKVCCNHEQHLRGNVYVQFAREEECAKAFAMFNARWYASRQLSCEFSPVTKWKAAICGLFERNRCPRGKNCNFLHVYRNPGNEFRVKDDVSPGGTSHNDWESDRSNRDWRRDQWNKGRDWKRDRRRERERGESEWSRSRDRDFSRRDWSRDHGRSRRRDYDKEEHSRRSERKQKNDQKRETKNFSSDEDLEGNCHQSERPSHRIEETIGTKNGVDIVDHPQTPKENWKRKHHSSERHGHRRKFKKKHKHHSKHKKKKHHNRTDNDSSSSHSEDDTS